MIDQIKLTFKEIVSKVLLSLSLMLFSLFALAQTEITSLSQITNMGGNYKLTADIDASGNTSLGKFTGTLDGGFHTISGLGNAIFTEVSGTVKNVFLDNVTISVTTANADVGAIANTASGNARIYNCGVLSTSGTSSISGTRYVGSIVGALANNARVLNCFSYANVGGGNRVAGIVGNNNGTTVDRTTILAGTGSMVFNCMFFGQITSGTNKYPVYGGTAINNVSNINTYNYFLYDDGITYANNATGASGIVDESLLTRFDMYRGILNSHRDLCAMYINNTQSSSDDQKHDIALWWYNPAQKETIPFLQLERCIVGTRRTLDRPIPTTMEDYKGRKLRDVSCTFVINGRSYTETLPITDMDVDNWDYTWGKIVLPFANEFSGWTLPTIVSTAYDNIITGWEITSITGGTPGSWDGSYDLCNPDCTAKDLYANSNYVWAQGGNYVVPTGVTAIEFTAHIARAVYLADSYVDIAYNAAYTQATNLGAQLSNDKYNGKTVYHNLTNAYAQLENKTNPADQAIVLVGNYHYNQAVKAEVFVNAYTGSTSVGNKATTIMSIDADNNQVPDYAFPQFHNVGPGRTSVPPLRFDFVCSPGIGICSYTRAGYLADVDILHTRGWLEYTETSMIHTTEFEIRTTHFLSQSPVIVNGGIHDRIIQTATNEYDGNSGNNSNLTYIRIGGKAYIKEFWPGHKNDKVNITLNGKPINMSGGQVDQLCLTSDVHNKTIEGDVHFYCNGGYIKEYLPAYQERISGNVTTKMDHALIDYFYGGGNDNAYATAQISGNIDNTINNSYVRFYCAGPKFGQMASGKTVTTHATGTTFGEYYGAGYGGTALIKVSASSASPTYGTGDFSFDRAWSNFTNNRLKYNASYGTGVGYDFLFNMYAGGNHKGNCNIFVMYATLSLASTKNVSSTLENCTIETNFYGGGCQGMVDGTINNSLTGCTVVGSVFGGGYKAAATPINVYPTDQPEYSVFKGTQGFFTPFGTTTPEIYSWVSGRDGTVDNTNKTIGTSVDMSQMGLVKGAITTTITGGTVGANVFGGGNESPSDNNATVLIKGNAQVALDAFGGGNIAPVGGNTSITLGESGVTDNTQVARDIYGGGALADVGGNTNVNLFGGSVTDVYGGGLGAKAGVNSATADVAALVTGNTTVTLDGSIVRGNIFGCNNLNGTPKGHAFVDIKTTTAKGTESQEHPYYVLAVYGGGNLAAYVPTNANEKTEVLIEHCDNSIENVFGGGNAAAVPGTDVTVWGGNIGRVFAGGNGASAPAAVSNDTHVTIHGGMINEVYGGSNTAGDIGGIIYVDVAEQKYLDNDLCPVNVNDLYGGGNLASSKAGHIRIGKCTLIDRVFGGANNADVSGDIVLNINEGHIDNVFGGNNNGGNINGNITVNVDWNDGVTTENAKVGNVYGGGNIAAINNAEQKMIIVNILNATTSGSVFGGGKGKTAVVKADTKVNIGDWNNNHHAIVTGNVFGGGDLAAVEGVCYVNIRDCNTIITGDLYGGGNAAPVYETNTTVWGGTIAGNLFGGGNGLNTNPETGNPKGAQVGYKSDDTTADGTGDANTYLYGGTIGTWNGSTCESGGGVFGGSNSNGNIHGKINLNVDEVACTESGASQCLLKLREVYGAGNEAAYAGEGITFNLGCVSSLGEIYGGAKDADLNQDVELNIRSGYFKKVFGGNNLGGKLNGNIVVNIDETGCNPVIIDELYGGGNLAAYSVYGYENELVDGKVVVKTSGSKLYADPVVNVISCTSIGTVYGGGFGASATMVGNPTVNINQIPGDHAVRIDSDGDGNADNNSGALGTVGTVFGGGNAASVVGNTSVNVGTLAQNAHLQNAAGTVNITPVAVGANITGNVYGGGNAADVTGKTNVMVGRD